MNREQANSRFKCLKADTDAAYDDLIHRRISQKRFDAVMTAAEKESEKIRTSVKTYEKARGFGICASPGEYDPSQQTRMKAVKQKNVSPADIPSDEWQGMFEAAKRKQPYRVEVKSKGFADSAGFKAPGAAISEGAPYPTGLFPPVIQPGLTQELRYEPDRLADHLPTITLEAPSIEYLIHSGNTNTAALTPELGVKVDLGMQMTTAIATPVKLTALASVSTEALMDFSYFQSFVSRELQRAVINSETDELVLGTGAPGMTGFVATAGVLTRSYNSVTDASGLDTLIQATTDIRVGAAFGEADLIAIHPKTWDFLRRTKSTQGSFVLNINNPNEIGALDNLFGVTVIQNTFIPEGTAVVLDSNQAARYFVRQGLTVDMNMWGDTEWTTNMVSFRAEMRSTLAVIRPAAVCVVVGLSSDTGAS
jgi:HK97 family phage major capsid protein